MLYELLLRVALADLDQNFEAADTGFLGCGLRELPSFAVPNRLQELMPVICQPYSPPVVSIIRTEFLGYKESALGQDADVIRDLLLSVSVETQVLPSKRVFVVLFEREEDVAYQIFVQLHTRSFPRPTYI